MKKIFILIGASGNLGLDAIKYFSNKKYDDYYFISRKPIDVSEGKVVLINDLSQEKDVVLAFNKIEHSKDNFYYLFNTVGEYWGSNDIANTPLSEWNRMINLNLTTNFLIAKHFIHLCKSGLGGSFITISAYSGIKAEPNKAAYSISKSGVNYLIKLLALENRFTNISFNGIAPYIIDSEENRKWVEEKSILISKENICKLAEDIFNNNNVITGNILELPYTNNLQNNNKEQKIIY